VRKAILAEIATALQGAEIPPRFQAAEARLLIHLWRLVAEGLPVSPEQVEQLASSLQVPLEAASSFVSKVSERDRQGNLVGIVGLSQESHAHRFEVNGHTLTTWCAWDSLFLPVVLKQTAKVESPCPTTKTRIRLTITPDSVPEIQPSTAVLSLVLPKVTKKGRESVEEIWMTFCHFVHFFCSLEAGSEWFVGRGLDPIFLSVEEGYELGRLAFSQLLQYAD
jgi:alkylmercury lyase